MQVEGHATCPECGNEDDVIIQLKDTGQMHNLLVAMHRARYWLEEEKRLKALRKIDEAQSLALDMLGLEQYDTLVEAFTGVDEGAV